MFTKINREGLDPRLAKYTDDELLEIGSNIQGRRISAGYVRQEELYNYLKTPNMLPNLQQYDGFGKKRKGQGEWDFIDHERKVLIDSKSAAYDNNVTVQGRAMKYLATNKLNYRMYFIITNAEDYSEVKWPIEKYKSHNIQVILWNDLEGLFNATD